MKIWRDCDIDEEKFNELTRKISEYIRSHDDIDLDDVHNRIALPKDQDNDVTIKDNNNNDTKNKYWTVKRLLISTRSNVNEAFERFQETFRFRKLYQISKLTLENSISKEFFDFRLIDEVGQDRNKMKLLILRINFYKKIPQLDSFLKRALLYRIEKLDLEYEQKLNDGITMVVDVSNFSLINVNLDLLFFVIKELTSNYRPLIQMLIIYELPYFLSYIVKLAESWIPTFTDRNGKKIKVFAVVDKNSIDEYIDQNDRPDYLNGNLKTFNLTAPESVLSFREMSDVHQSLNMNAKNVAKINKYVEQLYRDLK